MNNKDQECEAPTGPLIFTLPASSFIVVLGLDRLNGIFRSTLVPAFAKDSRLAGGDANSVGDHRSHGQVEVKCRFPEDEWTTRQVDFQPIHFLRKRSPKFHLTDANSGVRAVNQLN